MKITLPILAALMFVFVSSQAVAQSQDDQEACEGDVFNLCQDKIPDQDDIVACLRKKWSKVSKECRRVMIGFNKSHRKARKHDKIDAAKMNPAARY